MERYKQEFPDFGELDVTIPEGFEDCSWHNDACPSFWNEKMRLQIWVDYKKTEDREFGSEFPRFGVTETEKDGYPEGDSISSDDWNEILEYIERR